MTVDLTELEASGKLLEDMPEGAEVYQLRWEDYEGEGLNMHIGRTKEEAMSHLGDALRIITEGLGPQMLALGNFVVREGKVAK